MKKRHRRLVNSLLLKKCYEKLGTNFKKMYLVNHLIESYNSGEIKIKFKEPFEENDYYCEFIFDKIAIKQLNLNLSLEVNKDLKDYEALNILMYNFINQ